MCVLNKAKRFPGKVLTIRRILTFSAIAFLCLSLCFWIIIESKRRARRIDCSANIRELSVALGTYASEHNGKWPEGTRWCDDLLDGEYVELRSLRCPGDREGPCSYAINKYVAGLDIRRVPVGTVLLFESKPGWNQVGSEELLNADNHEGIGYGILFNQHTIRFIKVKERGQLNWVIDVPKDEKKQ